MKASTPSARSRRAVLREAAKAAALILLLCAVLASFFSVFRFKYGDGIYSIEKFYELEDDTVDVLVLGSSHAFEDINPAVLYADYGITAYDLCGSVQPLWNTYYYLLEALKTQQPRLVVLEAFGTSFYDLYADQSRIIKNTFGMKPSANLLNALRVSVPDGQFFEYLFRFFQYHNRYASISEQDFLKNQGMALYRDWKGFGCNFAQVPQNVPDALSLSLPVEPMYGKTETYFRKIIELCQSRSIPLEIVVSPYVVPPLEQMRYGHAAQVAAEYGVPFTNYNDLALLAELGLDYAGDMADGGHLNHIGNVKFTRHLGAQLISKYDLPDRRGDARFASWERNAAYFEQTLRDHALTQETDWQTYAHTVASNPNYSVFVSVAGDGESAELASILRLLGVTDDPAASAGSTRVIRNAQILARYQNLTDRPYFELDRFAFTLAADHVLAPDGTSSACVEHGVNFLVYSHAAQSVIDIVGFDAQNGFCAVRPERASSVF